MHDFRYAFRQLWKSPGFAAVAIATLALGIGANTAIFSIVNSVLLQPLPYPQPDRIMYVTSAVKSDPNQPQFSVSFQDYLDWRRDNTVFENLAISRNDSASLNSIAGRAPERISGGWVTANFFKVVGLSPQLGRTFTEDEDKIGVPLVVVISDRLWTRVFARDPAVLGQPLTFDDRTATIIGVMPPQFNSPENSDVWLPLMRRAAAWPDRAAHPMLFGWGRLKPGVTVDQARTEMRGIAARLEKMYPASNTDVTVAVTPLLDSIVGKYRTNLLLLLGAVGLVLLVACANLANLFAARGASRAREFAIRSAVGASRAQLIRQSLIESLVITVLGAALGYVVALWGRDLLGVVAPHGVSRFEQIHFDARVLAFTFLLASTTTVLAGLWPAWQSARPDVQLALKSSGPGASDSKTVRRTRDWLVIVDVALTLVLLSSAGLVLKSFARIQALSLGFEPRDLTTVRIDLAWKAYQGAEKVANFSKQLAQRVAALPGVDNVAVAAHPPLTVSWRIIFVREGVPPPPVGQEPNADTEVVMGDYFGTLQAPLLRGRAFTENDNKSAPLVAIIDPLFAEQIFRGEDPIGKRIICDPDDAGAGRRAFEIIGIAPRIKRYGTEQTPDVPVIYFSQAQVQRHGLMLLVRSRMQAAALAKPIRDIVAGIDPRQPIYDVRPMLERVADTWATQRLLTFLLSIFAGLALLLATIGLYGVLSYHALRRLREMAVRVALGATRGHVRALIFNHAARLLIVGCIIGVVGAIGASRALRSVLFQVAPFDAATYLLTGVALAIAAAIACWLPARRAASVDPVVTLRSE